MSYLYHRFGYLNWLHYLLCGSYLILFNPCGNPHFSWSLHRVSSFLRFLLNCNRWVIGIGSAPVQMLSMPLHLSSLKCSGRTPHMLLSLNVCKCLAYLAFWEFCVWPTYCLPHFLHWIRYTMNGVSHVAWPCVLYILLATVLWVDQFVVEWPFGIAVVFDTELGLDYCTGTMECFRLTNCFILMLYVFVSLWLSVLCLGLGIGEIWPLSQECWKLSQ